ncbi:MAG: DUF5615 family PIN-like protein [Steroidobacteraceae bacterium]
MRFLIDANLPRSIVATVTALGHEVQFARDVGLAAAPDSEVAARAKAIHAALITRDMGFADVRRYPPEQYAGIVVLRLPDDLVGPEITRTVERFLRDAGLVSQLSGRLAIVEADRVRFRPALP